MANTTTKTTKKTTSTKKATTKTTKAKVSEVNQEAIKNVPDDINENMIIIVKNGFHGKMVYISQKTQEKFIWDQFGDIQEMELRELRVAKNSSKEFFINNWFMFDEEYAWVISYLGLTQYYAHSITEDGFNEILKKKPDEISEILANMSNGQKSSFMYMVKEKVAHGEIDSLKTISALEESLGVELIEKQ